MRSKFLDKYHRDVKDDGLVVGVVEVAEYAAASYGFGWMQNHFRDRASLFGAPADLIAGGVLTAASLFGGKYLHGGLHRLVDTVGKAGLGSWFHTMGAGKGAQTSGVKRVLVDAKDVQKVKSVLPKSTVLGEIPKAPHGDFLSSRDLANLARS